MTIKIRVGPSGSKPKPTPTQGGPPKLPKPTPGFEFLGGAL